MTTMILLKTLSLYLMAFALVLLVFPASAASMRHHYHHRHHHRHYHRVQLIKSRKKFPVVYSPYHNPPG